MSTNLPFEQRTEVPGSERLTGAALDRLTHRCPILKLTGESYRLHFAQLFGEVSRSSHKVYLIRKIAWRLQSQAEGDLSIRARRRAAELANDADIQQTPPKHLPLPQIAGVTVTLEVDASHDVRLPTPGTALIRHYKGRTLEVLVLKGGFEFNGERYKSLSAVARADQPPIHIEWLPGYAPELNPVEYQWSHAKGSCLANFAPPNIRELRHAVYDGF